MININKLTLKAYKRELLSMQASELYTFKHHLDYCYAYSLPEDQEKILLLFGISAGTMHRYRSGQLVPGWGLRRRIAKHLVDMIDATLNSEEYNHHD